MNVKDNCEWIEYNIHIGRFQDKGTDYFNIAKKLLIYLIRPFVCKHKEYFKHWHYLLQPRYIHLIANQLFIEP